MVLRDSTIKILNNKEVTNLPREGREWFLFLFLAYNGRSSRDACL